MKLKIAAILTLGLLGATSCDKDEVEVWQNSSSFAWFSQTKPTDYTFVLEPDGVTQSVIELPITLASPVQGSPRSINIEIVRPFSNSSSRCTFENPVIVQAGATEAVLKVTVDRTANLKQETDTIVFAIRESADFRPGLPDNAENTLVVYDNYIRPEWWIDSNYNTDAAVGACNDLKLKVWYATFGNFDDPRGGVNWWTKPEAVLALFKVDQYSLAHYGKAFKDLMVGDPEIN